LSSTNLSAAVDQAVRGRMDNNKKMSQEHNEKEKGVSKAIALQLASLLL